MPRNGWAKKKEKIGNYPKVSILNEQGIESGTFGWCFVCRKAAGLYCKDTLIPVCSIFCKYKHIEELSRMPTTRV